MNDRERRYARLLWAYPRAYRVARGDEIVATLLEASPGDRRRPTLSDHVDLARHGLQLRLGLTSGHYGGRVLALAATPGVMMAGALSAVAFGFGEWRHPIDPHLPHFGPFLTVGPVVYLSWFLGALAVLFRPALRRVVALGCVAVSLLAIPIGDAFFDRPPIILVAMLVTFGLPAVIAPATATAERRMALVAGLGTGAVLCLVLTTTTGPFGTTVGSSFYRAGLWLLSTWMPTVLIAGLAFMVLAAAVHRPPEAGAVALLMLPWAALSLRSWPDPFVVRPISMISSAAVLAVLAGWLASNWLYDLKRCATT